MKLEHIDIGYEENVLEDINVTIPAGVVCAVMGQNGCGKSTLLKSLIGLIPLKKGKLYVDDEQMESKTIQERTKQMAYISQTKEKQQHITAEEFMLQGLVSQLSLFEIPKQKEIERVKEVLDIFDLKEKQNRYMDEMSGGEVSMLYVARAMMKKPKVLLLDEPLASLDYYQQFLYLKKIVSITKENKCCVMLVLHDPNLMFAFCEQLLLLKNKKEHYVMPLMNKGEKEDTFIKLNEVYEEAFEKIERNDSFFVTWKK